MAFSTLTGAIRIDASGVKEGVDEAEQEIDSLSGRMESAGQRMQQAGMAMTAGVTAPLTAMGALAVRQTGNFNQAMQQSIAVMGDVDEAMRERLEERAREVARTTTQSHQQAAESYYFLASAGLDAAQALEAMPEVAAFAEAGQMNMAEATNVATNVMSAFNLEASEMNEVTDTLTATVTSHNQTMQGMSDAMSRVAPTAAGMGVEIEETAAAIGLLGDVGIQGQRAGTALNRALTVLSNPTGKAAKRIEELGVAVRDSQGNMRSITEIMSDFESAGADASDMAAIFGSEAGPAMASLLQQGSGALKESTNNLREAEGATKEVAQTQRDTLNAELQIMRSNLADAGVAIGSQFVPAISAMSGHVNNAATAFRNLNDTQQAAIVGFGGLLAVSGPVLLALGTIGVAAPAVATGFGVLAGAATTAAGAANTFSWILTGQTVPALLTTQVAMAGITVPVYALIAAVGALAGAWATNLFGMRDATDEAAGIIGDVIDWLINKVNEIPGVDIEMGDVPGLSDITGAMPSADDFVPTGENYGQSTAKGMEQGMSSSQIPASKTPVPGQSAMQQEGQAAGESYANGMQQGMSGVDIYSDRLTDEMRSALRHGVEGYAQDVGELEDAPTEISEELFNAVLEEQGSVSADDFGISEEEFNILRQRYGNGGGAAAGGAETPADGTGETQQPTQTPATSTGDGGDDSIYGGDRRLSNELGGGSRSEYGGDRRLASLGSSGDDTQSSGSTASSTPAVAEDATQRRSMSGTQTGPSMDAVVAAIDEVKEVIKSLSLEGEFDDEKFDELVDVRVRSRLAQETDRSDRGVGN